MYNSLWYQSSTPNTLERNSRLRSSGGSPRNRSLAEDTWYIYEQVLLYIVGLHVYATADLDSRGLGKRLDFEM